ncbi:MAG: hypothetical protein DMG65_17385 [Candidatus Angelobacter sp. Gp1-AA117]|nr:MAG: hypothetical protein DMG65_17385 [Candidatus Angelobacter sp. Gp1-AA117]
MKRIFARTLRLFAVLAMLGSCFGQAAAPAAAPKPRHILLWKASSPTNTVYLLGSIHAGKKDMYPLPQAIESAFAASRVLAVEFNIKNIDQMALLPLIQQYGMYPGDDTLFKHVPQATADALNDFGKKHPLFAMALPRMKPWLAALTVVQSALQEAGDDPSMGIDFHFLDEAKTQRIEELESADFQIKLLASATEEEQMEMLKSTLKHAATALDSFSKLQNAYLAGDAETMLKLIHEEEEGPKSLMKKLLDDRNLTMAEHVDGFLKGKEPCFVVVGAGHIIGDKGIVKLLQDKGYKVEMVPTN